MQDRIEKQVAINAPPARVWRALTDHREFNQWFRVNLTAPFAVGQSTSGKITYPGYEHLVMTVTVQKMEPESLFSFKWRPYEPADDDKESEPVQTLVEFRLKATATGTLLTVTESGFDKVPERYRLNAFRSNDGGWTEQMKNINAHVAQNS